MNILLINHYAGSTEIGMEFRPYYLAREWVKSGHHVDIIAGDYSHLRIKNPKVTKDFQKEKIDGINYFWVRTGSYKGNGIKRALTMITFVGKLWRNASLIAKKRKPDVIISSSTYPLDTFAAQRIAKKMSAKLIHEVHDMWPSTPIELGGMSKWNPFIVIMRIAENSAYKHSDYVVSLPSCAKEYMEKHGLKNNKFINIPNGIDLSDWENPIPLFDNYKKVLQNLSQDNFIVGYFGGHALSNALDTLLDVAKLLGGINIKFVLVGDGVEKERLSRRAKEENIEDVIFLPSVPKKMIPELIAYFNCCYIGALNSPLYRFGICMNKIFDSMMAGKPIVCAIDTPDDLIERNKCGVMVKPKSSADIAETIKKIIMMPDAELKKMGENGRRAVVEQYSYEILAAKFERLFH